MGSIGGTLGTARSVLVLCMTISAVSLSIDTQMHNSWAGIRKLSRPSTILGLGLCRGPQGHHVEMCLRLSGGAGRDDAAIQLKNQGNTMFREKRFEEARDHYSKALEAMPDSLSTDKERVNCLNNRAACHVKLGDYEECIADCTRALGIDPRNEKARLRRGIALETVGQVVKAAADMVLLLTEKADNVHAMACLERCLEENPKLREEVVLELKNVIPSLGDPKQEAARMRAAVALSEHVFVGVLGLPHDGKLFMDKEGPRQVPLHELAMQAANQGMSLEDKNDKISAQVDEVGRQSEKEPNELKAKREKEQAQSRAEEEKKTKEEEERQKIKEEEERIKKEEERMKKEADEREKQKAQKEEQKETVEQVKKDEEAREASHKDEGKKEQVVDQEQRIAQADEMGTGGEQGAGAGAERTAPKEAVGPTGEQAKHEEQGEQSQGQRDRDLYAASVGGDSIDDNSVATREASVYAGRDAALLKDSRQQEQEYKGLSVKEQIAKKLQVPDKDPKRQLGRLADNVKDIDLRLEMLTTKVESLDHEELSKDKGPAVRLLDKFTKQCMEYADLIMMLTEGLDSVSSPEVRQDRRALVAQLQGLLVDCDKAKFKLDELTKLIVPEDQIAKRVTEVWSLAGNLLRTVWDKKYQLLFVVVSTQVLKVSKDKGLVETGYMARDKVLEVWDHVKLQLGRLQDHIFPSHARFRKKRKMTDKELQEFYRREMEHTQKLIEKKVKEREKEKEKRLKEVANDKRKKQLNNMASKVSAPVKDAVGGITKNLNTYWKEKEMQREAERLKEEMNAAKGQGTNPFTKLARWWKSLI